MLSAPSKVRLSASIVLTSRFSSPTRTPRASGERAISTSVPFAIRAWCSRSSSTKRSLMVRSAASSASTRLLMLVAARTLEFLAELGEDRGHVAGTQDLDVRGMSPRQRSKTNCQSQERCTGESYPHRISSQSCLEFPRAPKLHGRTRAEKYPRRTSNLTQDAVMFGRQGHPCGGLCCNCSRQLMAQGCPDPRGPKWVWLPRSTGRDYARRPGGRRSRV